MLDILNIRHSTSEIEALELQNIMKVFALYFVSLYRFDLYFGLLLRLTVTLVM